MKLLRWGAPLRGRGWKGLTEVDGRIVVLCRLRPLGTVKVASRTEDSQLKVISGD
jgi:hypothetical protein